MDTSATWVLDYESKTRTIDSKISGSFSIRIRRDWIVERTLVRSPSGRETLATQRTIENTNDEDVVIVFEIPPAFLAGEEICSEYVANVLSKARVNSFIQLRIIPRICKDAIDMSRCLGEEENKGFLVEAEVVAVREVSWDNYLSFDDCDSQGRRIPIESDCIICLEELSSGGEKKIMKLPCSHSFHRDCILPWLHRKHACPTCRDDIQNPRPKKVIPRMMSL